MLMRLKLKVTSQGPVPVITCRKIYRHGQTENQYPRQTLGRYLVTYLANKNFSFVTKFYVISTIRNLYYFDDSFGK